MTSAKNNHICTIGIDDSRLLIPVTGHGRWHRFRRIYRKSKLVSEFNPRSQRFYRSNAEIEQERKKQAESGTILIHPFSMYTAYFEVWMTGVYLLSMIYEPISITGYLDSFATLEMLTSLLMAVYLVTTFLTGYVDEKKHIVVMDAKKIALHYIFSIYFFSDLLMCLPAFNYDSDRGSRAVLRRSIDLLDFVRIIRFPTFLAYLSRSAELFRLHNYTSFKVLKHIILFGIVLHWITCIAIVISQLRFLYTGYSDPTSWMIMWKFVDLTEFSRYIRYLYRSTALLLCINIMDTGHIYMFPWEETLFEIVTFIFGKIFLFCMSVIILQMLLATRSLETKYIETMSQVKGYMRHKHMPIAMQKRLLQYYDYKYHKSYFKETVIAGLLSDKIKRDINLHVCKKLVQSVSLFKELPHKLVEEILIHLKSEIFLPNDVIIAAGSLGECMYFLSSGTVSVSTPSGREICHLQDGAYFGESALVLKDKKRSATIIAIEICEVFRLDRRPFKTCFGNDPALLQQMEAVAKERTEVTEATEAAYKQHFMDQAK